ncbi:hypothetical protein [Haloterrigena alkaliphila]|uniref:hypothetical protein n=1 Tax=Haloterrigena alkaliphila TaxID=2816475 RepID=UPI001CEC62A4|nr:hypothetical protein [Haloterrigena alkaliphila]UHQ95016.1 hypothetical protein J0X25_18865 [Haloterrigena alkaliphila]
MSDAPAAEDIGPFEEQRQIYELLSQETRHLILQHILGHPDHLPSLDGLAYLMPKNKAAIRDQLQVLDEAGLLDRYDHPSNENSRDLPSQFYGLTERGVTVLDEYNYLRGLPVARAVYDNTRLSEKAQRHRDAPRPELPASVARALTIESTTDAANTDRIERYLRQNQEKSRTVADQVEIVTALYENDIGPDHDGLKLSELSEQLADSLEYRPTTPLNQLVDTDLVDEFTPPGPNIFAISERLDEIVNGQIETEAETNIDALVAHIDDELQPIELDSEAAELDQPRAATVEPSVAMADGAGRTVRSILAAEFDIVPERVPQYLRSGDPVDRLNAAVDAIESSREVTKSEEYGRIVFVQQPYRYRLTERAIELLE